MNVLVLGAGQVGTFTARALSDNSHYVLCIDKKPSQGYYSRFGPIGGDNVEEQDISSREVIDDILGRKKWGAVIYALGTSSNADNSQNDSQLLGLLLDSLQHYPDTLLVYISSIAVYGSLTDESLSEELKIAPRSPYGEIKAEAEELLLANEKSKIVILRSCGLYGPIMTGRGSHSCRLIETALLRAKLHKQLKLSGAKGEGDEYMYVKDLADALASVISSDKVNDTMIFNVGTGTKTTVDELASTIESVIPDSNVSVIHEEAARKSLPPLDISKLKLTFGFEPKYTFSSGLAEYSRELGS